MDAGRVGIRYAKALFEYAKERGEQKQLYHYMQRLSQSFAEVSGLQSALVHPMLADSKKITLLRDAIGGDVSDIYSRFIDLVITNHREEYFHVISLLYQQIYRDYHHIVTGRLTTATPVDSKILDKLSILVQTRQEMTTEFELREDATLIGGFIFDVNGKRLDASLRSELERLTKLYAQ